MFNKHPMLAYTLRKKEKNNNIIYDNEKGER